MPTSDERKVSLKMMMTPVFDEKAGKKAIRDATELHKRLSAMKVDFKEVSRQSSNNIKQINDMAKAANIFSSRLSKGAQASYKHIQTLGKELEDATKEAEILQKMYKSARTKGAKSNIEKLQNAQAQRISSLNKQIDSTRSGFQKYGDELKRVQKTQQGYHRKIEQLSKFSGKDMRDGLMKGMQQMFSKGGGASGMGTVLKSLGKGAGGAVARKNLAGAGAGGAGGADSMMAMRGVAMAAGGLAAVAVSIGALVKLISMASDHQSKLNKTMLDGLGTANDFVGSTDRYSKAISDVRNASIDSARALLEFGARSEDALRTINAFAKESTGSVIAMRNEMVRLGDGDIKKGMTSFTKSSIAYGKALGIEMDQVGSMMGSFVGDVGYATSNVQGLMSEIVATAATSSMPIHKFMDIFRQTVPHLELFTNRIEELASVVKVLSKSMAPDQVKEFMNAWSQGFKLDSFQSRLKKTLVAGVGKTNNILAKGFASRADVMAGQLGGELANEFQAAFKSGNMGGVFDVITKAKSQGIDNPALFGQMTRLMQSEMSRRKGGALNTATALKGASMAEQLKLFKAQRATITGGGGFVTGIDEHVMEKLGYDQKQIEAMNNYTAVVGEQMSALQTYGATTSKSMNEALRKTIATKKGIGVEEVTREDMAKATEDQIMAATELSLKDQKVSLTAEDLAARQVRETTSLGDKLDNVIAFWLEKVFQALQPMISYLDKLYSWLTGSEETRDSAKAVRSWQDSIEGSGYSKDVKSQLGMVSGALARDLDAGVTGEALGQGVGSKMSYLSGSFKNDRDLQGIDQYLSGRAMATGEGAIDAQLFSNEIKDALKAGDMGKAFGKLSELGSDDAFEMQEFAKLLVSKFGVSPEAAAAAAEAEAQRRPGTQAIKNVVDKKDFEDQEMARDAFNAAGLGRLDGKGTGGTLGGAEMTFADDIIQGGANEKMEDSLQTQNDLSKEQGKTLGKLDRKMATGIRVDASDKTERVINTATLEAFRTALTEYAIHEMRMATNSEYAQSFADPDRGIVGSGGTLGDLAGFDPTQEGVMTALGTKHSGGPVDSNGMYRLLKGEHVLSQRAVANLTSGGGGTKSVHAEVHLHGTNIGPAEAQRLVESAVGNIMRRH